MQSSLHRRKKSAVCSALGCGHGTTSSCWFTARKSATSLKELLFGIAIATLFCSRTPLVGCCTPGSLSPASPSGAVANGASSVGRAQLGLGGLWLWLPCFPHGRYVDWRVPRQPPMKCIRKLRNTYVLKLQLLPWHTFLCRLN